MHNNIQFIEPSVLYNLLNQVKLGVPCITNEWYLLLFDSRKLSEYRESHVICATHVMNEYGYTFPDHIDYSAVEHIVVMDNRATSHKDVNSPAMLCADMLWKLGSKYPIKIVKGGYEDFTASYPFLRSQKVLYTQREIAQVKMYPLEVVPGFLYVGIYNHAADQEIAKCLKIKAHVNVTTIDDPRFSLNDTIVGNDKEMVPRLFNINIADTVSSDISTFLPSACSFISQHMQKDGETLLIYSDLGISRSVTIAVAYLINKNKVSLKEALTHVSNCHKYICPNRSFIKSLLDWEEKVMGERLTKYSELGFLSFE